MFNLIAPQIRRTTIPIGIAFFMSMISITFGQSVEINRSKNGQVHLKYSDDRNEQNRSFDTTFVAKNDKEFDRIMGDLKVRHHLDLPTESIESNGADERKGAKVEKSIVKSKSIRDTSATKSSIITYNITVDDKDGKKIVRKGEIDFDKSMASIEDAMKKFEKSMENFNMNISMTFDDDKDKKKSESDIEKLDNSEGKKKIIEKRIFHVNSDDHIEIPDSLDDEKHIQIRGDRNEEAPVLESIITTKSGNKVFVYKRNISKKNDEIRDMKEWITDFKVFPNPAKSELNVSFNSDSKDEIQLTVADENGKNIYKLLLNGIEGGFDHSFDISGKKSGTYVVKITGKNNQEVKKIIIEK